jgi:hypothetical protein
MARQILRILVDNSFLKILPKDNSLQTLLGNRKLSTVMFLHVLLFRRYHTIYIRLQACRDSRIS